MAGSETAMCIEALLAKDWTEDPEHPDYVIPPEDVWSNKPKSFSVDDAVDLQNMLGESIRATYYGEEE